MKAAQKAVELQKAGKKVVKKAPGLVDFSKWLADFDLAALGPDERAAMEVPGQYLSGSFSAPGNIVASLIVCVCECVCVCVC